MKIITETHRAH